MKKFLFFLVAFFLILIVTLFYISHFEIGDSNYGVAEVLAKEKAEIQPEIESGSIAYQVKLKILEGKYKGEILSTEHVEFEKDSFYNLHLSVGDKVVVVFFFDNGKLSVGIDGFYNSKKLIIIIFVFIAAVLMVAKLNGFKSLLSLLLTLILIFKYMSHFILKGYSPIGLAVFFSLIITLITFLTIGGWDRKTLAAISGTLGGVVLAGLMGYGTVRWLGLSGVGEQETMLLKNISQNLDLRGILIAGIIIGALGAVMDVAISISSSIAQIKKANPSYSWQALFKSGLSIGEDIIGTMTNTLVLAYAGSSFSTILLFVAQSKDFPLIRILNMELISIEIIRSLMGSLGMVMAIPITALVASWLYSSRN